MTKPHEELELGQFIPLHYHFHMLNDNARVSSFKMAIEHVVRPGARVLDLGGGTGVLSFFAARQHARVWCVERNPQLVHEARKILARNHYPGEVEVIEADAFSYLPPEPVDVVICEMVHVAMLREKQIPVIHAFKQRYLEKFGGPLPLFVPEAFIHAVQPVHQSFNFEGYYAPAPLFQEPCATQNRTWELGPPAIYQTACYAETLPAHCNWDGEITIERAGTLNALRFITKNILAILPQQGRSIDWHSQYMVVPLEEVIEVEAGQKLRVRFNCAPGDPLDALRPEVFAC
ncbi:MAG: methyltransferase domain-containing protein [Sulfuricella denitrificans]|nr:methyltransferase domain-containing protein [Sulfuricella denitrificans]